MAEPLEIRVDVPEIAAGVVHARGCRVVPSPAALETAITRAIERAGERTDVDAVRSAIRDMLRHGKYKPTGRGKPASEYLLAAATEGRFPRIHNVVDINNLVSLEYLVPVSVIDVDRARTRRFVIRRGREHESYVFNESGHEMVLRDLLLVASADEDVPCANPVKDSLATKVQQDTGEVLGILYGPDHMESTLRAASARYAEALERWAEATVLSCDVVPGGWR